MRSSLVLLAGLAVGSSAVADVRVGVVDMACVATRPSSWTSPSSVTSHIYRSQFTFLDWTSGSDELCITGSTGTDSTCGDVSAPSSSVCYTPQSNAHAYTCNTTHAEASYPDVCGAFSTGQYFATSQAAVPFGRCENAISGLGSYTATVQGSAAGAANVALWTSGSAAGWKFCVRVRMHQSVSCGSSTAYGDSRGAVVVRCMGSGGVLSSDRVDFAIDSDGEVSSSDLSWDSASETYQGFMSFTAPTGTTRIEFSTIEGDVSALDVNGDGLLGCGDLTSALYTALTNSPSFPILAGSAGYELAIDTDLDGRVSEVEARVFLNKVNPADFNQDGFVDFFDELDYVDCYENAVCPTGITADMDGDNFVDYGDYDLWVAAFEGGGCSF